MTDRSWPHRAETLTSAMPGIVKTLSVKIVRLRAEPGQGQVHRPAAAVNPVGFQNPVMRSELRFLRGWLVLVEQAAQDGSAGDLLGW